MSTMKLLALLLVPLTSAATQAPERPHAAPAIERFVIDPDLSKVGFDGTSTLHDFEGVCTSVFGELRVEASKIEAGAGGTFWIPVKKLTTDNGGRDEEMLEAMEEKKFPRIEFSLESVSMAANGVPSGVGHFLIHGISRQRHFPFKLTPLDDGGWHAVGGVSFNITDHGITPPDKVVVGMHDEVRVWFDLNYVPAPVVGVDANAFDVSVVETVEPLGGDALTSTGQQVIWTRGSRTLLESGSDWTICTDQGTLNLDPLRAQRLPANGVAEEAFKESMELVASLKGKLAKLSGKKLEKIGPKLEKSIARTSESLAFAPSAGPATVIHDEGNQVSIMIGDQVWASFQGLKGEARFPGALAAAQGIPSAVRTELRNLRGVPTAFEIRMVHPTRRKTLKGTVHSSRPVSAPAWIFSADIFSEQEAEGASTGGIQQH